MVFGHQVFMDGRRSFKRWKCNIPVDYVVDRRAYRDFIHDISDNGAFIGCKVRPRPGEKIVMTFAWKEHIKSFGTVIRTDSDGFAVQFAHPLSLQ